MSLIAKDVTNSVQSGSSGLDVRPLNGVFGAEISGIDMSLPVDEQTVEQIGRLVYEYKVLVFRDQFTVGPVELASFAAKFGVPETAPHPELPDWPGTPAVKVITKDGSYAQDTWHTDGATRTSTRWLSFLQAVDIPPYGRDTLYADMEAVFDSLSPTLQTFLSGLSALHSWGVQDPDAPPIAHPMVVDNPVTGRRSLYVNRGYTRSIVGLHTHESDLLLEFLHRRAHIPEYQLRVVWRPGSIVLWDNQRTLHYIVQDSRYRRTMHRVMVLAEP